MILSARHALLRCRAQVSWAGGRAAKARRLAQVYHSRVTDPLAQLHNLAFVIVPPRHAIYSRQLPSHHIIPAFRPRLHQVSAVGGASVKLAPRNVLGEADE